MEDDVLQEVLSPSCWRCPGCACCLDRVGDWRREGCERSGFGEERGLKGWGRRLEKRGV